jgi:hypothetical protein
MVVRFGIDSRRSVATNPYTPPTPEHITMTTAANDLQFIPMSDAKDDALMRDNGVWDLDLDDAHLEDLAAAALDLDGEELDSEPAP